MDILNLIRISVKALLRNKTRTALSMLGIVIGIAAVIAVVNLGEGLKQSTANQLSDMGTNLIMVMRANQRRGGVSMGSSNVQSLKVRDCELIAKGAKNVTMVSPVVNSGGQLVNGSKNWSGTVYGGSPDYLEIRKYEIATGVNFTEEDVKKYAKVGLIGQTIVEELFDDGEDPIGKTIRVGNMPFRVIGTLKERGENGMGMDQDDLVVMPYSTVQKRMLGVDYIQQIVCSAASEDVAEAAVEEIENILRASHKIPEGGNDDFEVRTQQEMLEMMSSMTGMITTVLVAIALISLLVGCIGIMNIMYVTVTEEFCDFDAVPHREYHPEPHRWCDRPFVGLVTFLRGLLGHVATLCRQCRMDDYFLRLMRHLRPYFGILPRLESLAHRPNQCFKI